MTTAKKICIKLSLILATLGITCTSIGLTSKVNADTYYGNGVYCNKNGCKVDWGQAVSSIANNIVAGAAQGASNIKFR